MYHFLVCVTSVVYLKKHSMVVETTHLGVKEQLIFPEIEYDKVDKVRGMDIVIVTTANTDEEARELLTSFGMPFKSNESRAKEEEAKTWLKNQ